MIRSYDVGEVGSMRALVIVFALGCTPPPDPVYVSQPAPAFADPDTEPPPPVAPPPIDQARRGSVVDRLTDFAFDGGWIEFELRRDGDQVIEVARNHYAVAITLAWQFSAFRNLQPMAPTAGVVVLPAARVANGDGAGVALTIASINDSTAAYHRQLQFHARFGDPQARPQPYVYRLPYAAGSTFAVLQGFHGAFSHRGSNEYAVDFDCPVATHVMAARPGVVVATHAAAQGSGTTPDYLEYKRTNFVLVLHDDGTLGEYMHLAPSGVTVTPGQQILRGEQLGLSGNTGFSSTPHLHFQVMTAGDDGVTARSFPFELATAAQRREAPVQGQSYASWEPAAQHPKNAP